MLGEVIQTHFRSREMLIAVFSWSSYLQPLDHVPFAAASMPTAAGLGPLRDARPRLPLQVTTAALWPRCLSS